MSKTYTYGVVTDEISQDLEQVCQVATELGMTYVEPHRVWDKPVFELTDEEVEKVGNLLAQYGIHVHLVCGLFFRPFSLADVELDTMETHPHFVEHMDRLARYIKLAKAWNAPNIRAFGFTRDDGGANPSPRSADGGGIPDDTFAKIVKGFNIACQRLADEGLTLALENARSLYANTGGNMRRILDAVDHSNLKIIWDPANAFVAGEDPAEGYAAVKGHLVDIHCKDATVVDGTTGLTAWTRIGDGGTDWEKQFALLADDPTSVLTVETHWKSEGSDRADNTRQTFSSLKSILEKQA